MSHRQQGRGEAAVRQGADAGVVELVGDPDRPRAWTLLVDGTPQSHVDLDDPRYLVHLLRTQPLEFHDDFLDGCHTFTLLQNPAPR